MITQMWRYPGANPGFPIKGGADPWGGQHGILPNFQKLHEVESIFGCGGIHRGRRPRSADGPCHTKAQNPQQK